MEPSRETNNVFDLSASNDLNNKMPTSSRKFPLKIILILVLVILLLAADSFISYSLGKDSQKAKANRLNQLSNPNSPMFAGLSGTISGKITKVEENTISIESIKGGKGVFNIGKPISISEIKSGKLTELGNTKESIRLDENALIKIVVLGFNDGYVVNEITYIKDTPAELIPNTATKSASVSAKPKFDVNNE